MFKQEWCQIELENGRKPYDLNVCKEKCQTCPVKDECVRWIDANKSDLVRQIMKFDYDKSEEVNSYIYFYKSGKIIAEYSPFVGLCVKEEKV